ncbi:MAG: aspartate ammonia-lyase [Gemmatimonadaceae bacterium]|nr:aspartate ammonia-lyase [Gemmatimonadaceae bacterium]MCW5827226.1 aspartate ammonia-lyase [Gemmatimonadaceae bacterium]
MSTVDLNTIPFFAGLPDQLRWHLSRAAERIEYPEGERLFRDGEPRRALWVILEGTLAIELPGGGDEPHRLATLGPGDVVGESILLGDDVHHTEGKVLAPLVALRFEKFTLEPLLKDQPRLHAALLARSARVLAARLKSADGALSGRDRAAGFGGPTRTEKDLLGERDVPQAALFGVQTLRAIENFPITGVTLQNFPDLIVALAQVKEAAARANMEIGTLPADIGEAIIKACREIAAGTHHEHFRVDMIQGGAGTSTNMNANEVIANRACELLGVPRGSYARVHPNEHVNLSQSTNDVYPTAVRLALHAALAGLQREMRALVEAFRAKGQEFAPHVKMGRTQLQDAVPMTLGQEFTAFGNTIAEDVDRLEEAKALLREINMGATAIGTRITAPEGYTEKVRAHLSQVSGLGLITAPDLVEATSDTGGFVQLSGVLKRCAVKLSKVCNDLRLLSSGPRTGFGEIRLPPMQPGSSIMPGKVNPVIPEAVNQVCFDVIGGDVTVTMAAEAGQLQLNVFEPIIAFRLLRHISAMTNACRILREKCVVGIEANPQVMRDYVERSIGLVTALLPTLGYEQCTALAKEALESGRGVAELVLEKKLMTRKQLDAVLDPARMVSGAH